MPPTFRDEGLRAAVEARRRHPGLGVLVLSAHVEESYASELLAGGATGGGIGYLLKERVGRVTDFLDALRRVAAGGTALDPEVVAQLIVRRRADDPLHGLTPRERDVLARMAEGHSNTTIARQLVVTDGAVHKHIGNIFAKLGLAADDTADRRVAAVLAYLRS
jgi:DNA-binding NarL/FixJ family response regulator